KNPFRRFLVAICCCDSELSYDIAHESYIKGYLSIDGFRDSDKFASWIYRIGYNTFLNHRRSLKPYSGYTEAEKVSAEEKADSAFRYQALYSALDRLSPTERTSILLYYMEGYSIREISKIENVSEDAVKKHLQRGRQHLKGILSEKD
ncbi:MAG: RNA polymerase sigma factor, partial [Muribaculaceae bacterium]|nr:RNA polymerase sigma factor [Muribaculaceae bacterium]